MNQLLLMNYTIQASPNFDKECRLDNIRSIEMITKNSHMLQEMITNSKSEDNVEISHTKSYCQ